MQIHTPTGSRWMSNNYITRCHRRLELVSLSSSCSWSQLGSRCRIESQRQMEGFGHSVTHSWAAQLECERSAARFRRTLGHYVAVCPRLQLTSHTQPTSTLLNKAWELYFYKEVCPFIHWSRQCVEYVSAYICICIFAVVLWIYNIALCKSRCNFPLGPSSNSSNFFLCYLHIQHFWYIVMIYFLFQSLPWFFPVWFFTGGNVVFYSLIILFINSTFLCLLALILMLWCWVLW